MALIKQEALFIENSGVSGTTYQADFPIPANAMLEKVHTVMLHPWNDSGGGSLQCGFNGTGAPTGTCQNLHDATGSDGGALVAPNYSTGARTFSLFITGLNNDGSAGITQAEVFYSTTDPIPVIPVSRF